MGAAGGRRRVLVLGLAMLGAVGLAVAGQPAQAAASPPYLALTVRAGYGGLKPTRGWAPVVVDVVNSGSDFTGTVEIGLNDPSVNFGVGQHASVAGVLYTLPLEVRSGEGKRLRAYLPAAVQQEAVVVRVVSGGIIVAAQVATWQEAGPLIGVLSDSATAFDDLGAVRLAGGGKPWIVHLQVNDLPERGELLSGFRLLAVDDFTTDLLTTAQRTAVGDYVAAGGNLLLGTGGAWRATIAGLSPGLLPMQLTATTITSISPDLVRDIPVKPPASPVVPSPSPTVRPSGVPTPGPAPTPAPQPTQAPGPQPTPAPKPPLAVEIATGSVTGYAWLTNTDGNPLLVEKAVGAGTVTMSTFDWTVEPMASWSGTRILVRQVAVRSLLGQAQTPRSLTTPATWLMGRESRDDPSQQSQLLSTVMTLPQRDLPSVPFTGLWVLVYGLLIFPGNYLLLRAAGRRELAWVTLPLIAVAFIVTAYVAGLGSKARQVQANQLSIVSVQPGWGRAEKETYTGVFAPNAGDYTVGLSDGNLVDAQPQGAGTDVVRVDGQGRARVVGAGGFTMHGFRTESSIAAPAISVSASVGPGQLIGAATNSSSLRLDEVAVIAGDAYQSLGAMAPGGTASFTLTSVAFDQPFRGQIYASYGAYTSDAQPSADQIQAAQRNAVIAAALGSPTGYPNPSLLPPTFSSPMGPVSPLLIAFATDQSPAPTVNGAHPLARSQVAFVIPITILAPTGTLPAGLVKPRLVDVTGALDASLMNLSNGVVTYEITLPPSGFSPIVPPVTLSTADTASLVAEIWDWPTGAWKSFDLHRPGSLLLTQTAIDPTSGTVRIRMAPLFSYQVRLPTMRIGVTTQ